MSASARWKRSTDTLNTAQRIVVSLGAAAALIAVGRAAERTGSTIDGGWFAYVPLTALPESPFIQRHPGLRLLMWLALIGVWVALSLWLFRTPAGQGSMTPSMDPPDRRGQAQSEP